MVDHYHVSESLHCGVAGRYQCLSRLVSMHRVCAPHIVQGLTAGGHLSLSKRCVSVLRCFTNFRRALWQKTSQQRTCKGQIEVHDHHMSYQACSHPAVTSVRHHRTMKLGSTAKVLAECKLKYYRISVCIGNHGHPSSGMPVAPVQLHLELTLSQQLFCYHLLSLHFSTSFEATMMADTSDRASGSTFSWKVHQLQSRLLDSC